MALLSHGINVTEVPTSVLPPASVAAGLPVVIGAAPVWQIDGANGGNNVNVPVLCNTIDDFVKACGDSTNWTLYPACEAADLFFRKAKIGPVVFINPLDPVTKGVVQTGTATLVNGVVTLAATDAVLSTLVVKSQDGTTTYVAGTDYTAAYNTSNQVVITRKAGGAIATAGAQLSLTYKAVTSASLVAADVVTAIGAVERVYPATKMVPGTPIAPGWSHNPTVAAALVSEAGAVNGVFKALALCDLPTDTVTTAAQAIAWVATNNYTGANQVNCWPHSSLGGSVYHGSVELAARMCLTDSANGDIPYVSPSNQTVWADSAVLHDGTHVYNSILDANNIEGGGIVTSLNWSRGWVAWGNRTGAYPGSTDPKDTFICIRRMFNWIGNTLVTSFWQAVDVPINPRNVETWVTSVNTWFNGLRNCGALLGGKVQFNQSENPATSMMAGIVTLRCYIAPPPPAAQIDFVLEFDVNNLTTLFTNANG